MAELNTIRTRIISKHADLASLNASTTFVPYKGEIVFAEVTTYDNNGVAVPCYLMKVGNGTDLFKNLKWAGAQALDVYSWAKQANFPVIKTGAGNVISDIEWIDAEAAKNESDATLKGGYLKLSTANVATSESLGALQDAVTALTTRVTTAEGDIDTLEDRMDTVEATLETKANTQTVTDLEAAYKAADTKLAEDIAAAESAAKSHAETKASAAESAAKTHADNLNTAMDTRVGVLEGIDHDAYKAADTALKTELEGKITAEAEARSAADSSIRTDFAAADTNTKNTVIGTSKDASTADTIHGAKKYADEKAAAAQAAGEAAAATAETNAKADTKTKVDAEVEARVAADNALGKRIDDVVSTIQALEGTTHFIGVKSKLPATANNGDICIVGNKEYVYDAASTAEVKWVELGDTTAEAEAIQDNTDAIDALIERVGANEGSIGTLTSDVEGLKTGKADAGHKHVMNDITDLAARLSGIDTAVNNANTAATNALTQGKAYTDEQVAAAKTELQGSINTISGNVTTLSGRVDTAESDIDTLEGKMTTAEGKISALEGASATHATKDELTAAQTAAANDATSKANAAQAAAEATAAADATSKANAAQAAAEATAAAALEAAVNTLEAADESLDGRIDTIETTYLKVKDNTICVNDQVIIFDCGGIE